MRNWKNRTEMLLGSTTVENFEKKHVIVFGIGGVGGHLVETLVRAGIGEVTIVDFDVVDESNINRQLIALHSTIGRAKIDVLSERLLDINPKLKLHTECVRYSTDSYCEFDLSKYDFVADAIDEVTGKLILAEEVQKVGVPFIAAMGAGDKIDPTKIQISTLYQTKVCPLARVMRQEGRKRNLEDYPVVYSTEKPNKADKSAGRTPTTIAYMPPMVGMFMAYYILNTWIETER